MIKLAETISYLQIHPLTRGLAPDNLELVAQYCNAETYATGTVLCEAQSIVDSIYLIISGRLSLSYVHPNGRETLFNVIGPGNQFGAVAAVAGEPSPFVVRIEESALLIRIGIEDAQEIANRLPLLRRNLLKLIGSSLKEKILGDPRNVKTELFGCYVADTESRQVLPRLVARLSQLGEKLVVCTDQPHRYGTNDNLRLHDIGQIREFKAIWQMASQYHDCDRIFVELPPDTGVAELTGWLGRTGQFWCLAAPARTQQALQLLEKLKNIEPSWRHKTHFICPLLADQQVAPWNHQIGDLVKRYWKIWTADADQLSTVQANSIERLVHFVRGAQVGLALGGGAARGMAHLGVLQALEDAGIVIDMISGTSAGVLTGLTYCAGFEPSFAVENFTRDLTPAGIFQRLPKGSSWYLLSKYRSNAWDKMLRKYLHDWQLEQCPIPGYSVTADLIKASQVVRDSGDIVQAILESINLPILSPPICADGMALVDGSILNVLPADVLVERGCRFVIGVDVASKIEDSFAGNTPDTPTDKMSTPGVMTTLLRVLTVVNRNMSEFGAVAADFTITPRVGRMDATNFAETPRFAKLGRRSTAKAIPRLKQALQNLDPQLFDTER